MNELQKKRHVPYRDSTLTRLLQNALGGNCKTALVICASPHMLNRYETIRSLKFGLRCQQIENFISCEEEQTGTTKEGRKFETQSQCKGKEIECALSLSERQKLHREIQRLNMENDLLRSKDELSDELSILNQTISTVVLQVSYNSVFV